jgi:hypothetical protein
MTVLCVCSLDFELEDSVLRVKGRIWVGHNEALQ